MYVYVCVCVNVCVCVCVNSSRQPQKHPATPSGAPEVASGFDALLQWAGQRQRERQTGGKRTESFPAQAQILKKKVSPPKQSTLSSKKPHECTRTLTFEKLISVPASGHFFPSMLQY
jgi:hypothetical protein